MNITIPMPSNPSVSQPPGIASIGLAGTLEAGAGAAGPLVTFTVESI
jgi:hypothetical protein